MATSYGDRAVLLARRALGPVAARARIRLFDVFYGERRIEDVPPVVRTPIALEVRAIAAADVEPMLARALHLTLAERGRTFTCG